MKPFYNVYYRHHKNDAEQCRCYDNEYEATDLAVYYLGLGYTVRIEQSEQKGLI
jgi:hypothetical protein